jgi:hypothetical protein
MKQDKPPIIIIKIIEKTIHSGFYKSPIKRSPEGGFVYNLLLSDRSDIINDIWMDVTVKKHNHHTFLNRRIYYEN